MDYQCKICNKKCSHINGFVRHIIRTHKMTTKQYYDNYVDNGNHTCKICNKDLNQDFISLTEGYPKLCKNCKKLEHKVYYTNGSITKKFGKDDIIPNGWYKGSSIKKSYSTKNKMCINNGKIQKFIEKDEKIPNGWKKGGLPKSEEFKLKVSKIHKGQKHSKETIEKLKKSHNTKEYKEKLKQIFLTKYGVDNPMKVQSVKNKISQTNLRLYGVKNTFQLEKTKDILKHRYEDDDYKIQTVRKSKETRNSKYGEYFNNVESRKQTNLTRYGREHYAQTEEFHKKKYKKYEYDEKKFDSSYELVFYIYCKDKGLEIEQEPCKLEYEFEGKTHYYFPDFRVNGELVELKGKQFFKDGVLINPYDRGQDGLYKAKFECMTLHKVKIITEIKKYKEYVKNLYGEKFIKLCKK